jgi:hypothetical protein
VDERAGLDRLRGVEALAEHLNVLMVTANPRLAEGLRKLTPITIESYAMTSP